jgi:spore germination protein YaaH
LLLCLLGLLATSCVWAASSEQEASPGKHPPSDGALQLWGYVPNFDREAAWQSAQDNADLLTGISLFQYHVSAAGTLNTYPYQVDNPPWLGSSDIALIPMITNSVVDGWDRESVASVIHDQGRRRQHIEQVVDMVMSAGHLGVELDYESLESADRDMFSQFVEELADELHARNKTLAVALHAKTSEPGDWHGAQAQDWLRLGAAADRIIVMTYDHDPSLPGPIAPLAWTRDVLRFALSQIDSAKVLQGIPLYGYDWSDDGAREPGTHEHWTAVAKKRGATVHRDEVDEHLTFEYASDGVRHRVWFTDAQTVAALSSIGREVGVAGYAVWHLGGENAEAIRALPVR